MKKILCIIFLAMFVICASAQRWQISSDQGIVWTPKNDLPHSDHIEMSGEQTSLVLRWGVDDKGAFQLERSLVFPMLRKHSVMPVFDFMISWSTKVDFPKPPKHSESMWSFQEFLLE